MTSNITTPTEKEVEHACDQLMKALGWTVVRFSQARATRQSFGIPDRKYYPPLHPRLGSSFASFWFECKRPGGKQSEHQKTFQIMCRNAFEDYVLGGIPELVQYLNDSGIQKMKLHA